MHSEPGMAVGDGIWAICGIAGASVRLPSVNVLCECVCVCMCVGGGSQLVSPLPNYRDRCEHVAFLRQLGELSRCWFEVVCSVPWLTRNVVMVIN